MGDARIEPPAPLCGTTEIDPPTTQRGVAGSRSQRQSRSGLVGDGVTESLTTDLSRIRGAVVIARNTAFTYKGKPVEVKTIGRELNVRYVLEDSVQRGGNRMRVNVQLIDAETGNHLWAERFDKPLADLFDMQDEIVARLAGALNAQLAAAEARRAEGTATISKPLRLREGRDGSALRLNAGDGLALPGI